MDVDPDYAAFAVDESQDKISNPTLHLEKTARKEVVGRIKGILTEQFDKEIEIRENELTLINERLTKARHIMDRLRACVVASYYAKSFTKSGDKGPGSGASQHPAIQNVLRRGVTAVLSKNPPPSPLQKQSNNDEGDNEITDEPTPTVSNQLDGKLEEKSGDVNSEETSITDDEKNEADTSMTSQPEESLPKHALGGRFRVKKTIIVGNVSKYIPGDQRETSDKSTHKWMVYVRGDKENPRIDNFVRKVWFFLHPSYRPHDIVEVAESPFHLTRRGWGEFPIRVQIHFCDRRARPVDIIHGLKLDRTYTGLQTLGAETVCEVELDQSSIQSSPSDILETELTHISMGNGDEGGKKKSEEIDDQESFTTGSELNKEDSEVAALNGNQQLHALDESATDKKRKYDTSLEATEPPAIGSPQMKKECVISIDVSTSTPIKRRRKRRIDFSPEGSTCHNLSSSKLPSPAAETDSNKIRKLSSPDEPQRKEKESFESETEQASTPSATVVECESVIPANNTATVSKPSIIMLPRSLSSDTLFRMRSSSAGDIVTKGSASDLIKSAISISPAISVKVTSTASFTSNVTPGTNIKNISFSTPKIPNVSCRPKAIVLPVSHKTLDVSDVSKSGKEAKESQPRSMIPLSTLFKKGSGQTTKPLVLKVGSSSQRASPTFSINILNLGTQGSPKIREKRSLSADFTSPPKITSFTPSKSSKLRVNHPTAPITQLHIISPSRNFVKPTVSTTAISLQHIQHAISSGNIKFTQKPDSKIVDTKMNAKEQAKNEVKMQPVSAHGSDGVISTTKPKGKKATNVTVKVISDLKQDSVSKSQNAKEVPSAPTKSKPIHQVIGDSVMIPIDTTVVIQDLLPPIVKKVPLVRVQRDILNFPFCATSESEFLLWNVGKQRASELKRSILMQDVLKYLIETKEQLKSLELPSKKFIMDWCLKHGYSIFTDEFEESGDESSKAEIVSENMNIAQTVASSRALIQELEQKGESVSDDEECVLVDVTSVNDTPTVLQENAEVVTPDEVITDLPEKLTTLISSAEMGVVEQQTRQIGIQLRHTDGLPSSQMVLTKALQQFVESILRVSLCKRLSRRDGTSLQRIAPDEIHARDVVDAIRTNDILNFLTDNHLASDY